MNVNAPMLNESVRIPLHELQADVDYLIGRVVADGSCSAMIATSIKTKLAAIEKALMALPPAERKTEALIHTICPHIRQWSDGEEVTDFCCQQCPPTVQTSHGEGVQMCRLNAEKCADAILALPPAPIPERANAPLVIDPADREFQP